MAAEERPVYLRLRDSIAAMILEGKVRDGDPLPSVRSLAAEHGANPLTVAKAYQTFQDEGFVVVRRGVGMFVAAGAANRLRNAERDQFLNERWPGRPRRCPRHDAALGRAVCAAFDDAESMMTGIAVRLAADAPPESTLGALRIIAELREAVIQDESICGPGEPTRR